MGESNQPSPALTLSSSPFSSSTEGAHSFIYHPPTPSPPTFTPFVSENTLQNLSSNIEGLLSFDADNTFSDVLIYVSGRPVPLHRCILSARCPFFKALFSNRSGELSSLAPHAKNKEDSSILKIDLQKLLDKFISSGAGQVGFEAFIHTISFLYSGKQIIPVCKCIDQDCLHEACWPAVKFGIEMLCLASIFDISELKLLWQHQLHNMVEKAQVEELLPVVVAAKVHGPLSLLLHTKHLIAVSTVDTVDLQKRLPVELCEEVISLRHEMGPLLLGNLMPTHEDKEVQKIRKALDSDDVELVQLLLKEGRVSLNDAHALHYATSYCNPQTVQELLELELADVNLRDNHGLTVLHLASMRREPAILVRLLSKGANPLELTPDGRTAFQLCMRLISSSDHPSHLEPGEELQNDRLSVEILDQAGRQNPFANVVFSPVADEKELLMRLLYLENRVAVARLLFPQEAKLVTGISQLEATSEFTGLRVSDLSDRPRKVAGVDLNKVPLCHASLSEMENGPFLSTPVLNEALMKRVLALQRTVELAKRIFPRCSSIVNSFMDDDISELSYMEIGSPEEQKTKKRRYSELKDMLAEAFRKDVAAMDRHKPEKGHPLNSSSSSSSSRQT